MEAREAVMETEVARRQPSSPARRARIAGALYVLSFLSAILAEEFLRGKIMRTAGFLPILCFAVVTLILYRIFASVNRRLSLLATLLNLASLASEALELHPRGINVALVLHGGYCLVIAALIFRSKFLPRILSAPMGLAGLAWMVSISPQFAREVHAYMQSAGFAGEGIFMLWLLAKGVNSAKWKEQETGNGL